MTGMEQITIHPVLSRTPKVHCQVVSALCGAAGGAATHRAHAQRIEECSHRTNTMRPLAIALFCKLMCQVSNGLAEITR